MNTARAYNWQLKEIPEGLGEIDTIVGSKGTWPGTVVNLGNNKAESPTSQGKMTIPTSN